MQTTKEISVIYTWPHNMLDPLTKVSAPDPASIPAPYNIACAKFITMDAEQDFSSGVQGFERSHRKSSPLRSFVSCFRMWHGYQG